MQYAIKDACAVTLYERATQTPVLYTDYLNGFNLSLSADSVYATARGTNKIAFDGAMEGTVTLEAEVIEFKYMALLLGSQVVTGDTQVAKRVVGQIDAQKKVTLKGISPVNGSISLFSVEKDLKSHVEELTFTATNETGNTVLNVSSSTAKPGTDVVVYYLENKVNVKTITVNNQAQSANYSLHGYTTMVNEFGQTEIFSIKIPNCKPQRSIELSLSADSVANFSTTFDVLADQKGDLVELTLLGEETVSTVNSKSSK